MDKKFSLGLFTNPVRVRFCFATHIPGSACLADEVHMFSKWMRRLQLKFYASIYYVLLRKNIFLYYFIFINTAIPEEQDVLCRHLQEKKNFVKLIQCKYVIHLD